MRVSAHHPSAPASTCHSKQVHPRIVCISAARKPVLGCVRHWRTSGPAVPTPVARPVAANAKAAPDTAQVATEHWWKKDAELWTEVKDPEEFQREVIHASQPVIVEWFASWCTGCQRSYPEICKVIKNNPDLSKQLKFVKVCVDDMKAFSREQGVTALPRMSLYRPGQGRVLTWDVPLSRVKHLKKNLDTVVANPTSSLALDPNSFIIPTGPAKSAEESAKVEANRVQAIAALNQGSQSLFERLKAVASGGGSNGKAASAASTPMTALTPAARPSQPAATPAAPAETPGAVKDHKQAIIDEFHELYKAQFGHTFALEKQMFINKKPCPGDLTAIAAGDMPDCEAIGLDIWSNGDYGYGGLIDSLYPVEVGVRMQPVGPKRRTQHYLDYTGSGVYCNSQLEAVFKELSSHMYGNPHAVNPSSSLSSERIDEMRDLILKYFNADPAEWQVAFTRSATGALKLVGETFPWSSDSLFRYLRENHNSVLGIREYALNHKAAFQAVDENLMIDWLRAPPPPWEDDGEELPSRHDHAPGDCTGTNSQGGCEVEWDAPNPHEGEDDQVTYSLFAYPAEDNFAGVKYPLSWAAEIKKRSTATHKWMVLIDAAAYAPTQPLDLSKVQADFVDIAFYKMFGYPTGLGALLVRTEAVPVLRKVFWGGGSVALATSKENFHVLKCRPSEMLEDGTVSFLDIIALKHGFAVVDKLGGIAKVQAHVACLTEWLYDTLSRMRHSNGKLMVRVFGKHARQDHRQVQGGIVNFQLRSPQGQPLSYKEFEKDAAAAGFHIRTGAECNPGACYAYLGISDEEIETLAGEKEGCEDDVEYVSVQRPASQAVLSVDALQSLDQAERLELGLPQPDPNSKWVQAPLGSIRASLGWLSTFEDVYALAQFVSQYKDRTV